MRRVAELVSIAALAGVLVLGLLPVDEATPGAAPDTGANDSLNAPPPAPAGAPDDPRSVRERVLADGASRTGADNLVTAIYLGYRAYDTLGETVVLLLAVTGVVVLIRRRDS